MTHKIILILLLFSLTTLPVITKRTVRKDNVRKQKIIDIDEFAEMRRQHEKRKSIEREINMAQVREEANAITKCIDITKIIVVIVTSLVGLIINGTR